MYHISHSGSIKRLEPIVSSTSSLSESEHNLSDTKVYDWLDENFVIKEYARGPQGYFVAEASFGLSEDDDSPDDNNQSAHGDNNYQDEESDEDSYWGAMRQRCEINTARLQYEQEQRELEYQKASKEKSDHTLSSFKVFLDQFEKARSSDEKSKSSLKSLKVPVNPHVIPLHESKHLPVIPRVANITLRTVEVAKDGKRKTQNLLYRNKRTFKGFKGYDNSEQVIIIEHSVFDDTGKNVVARINQLKQGDTANIINVIDSYVCPKSNHFYVIYEPLPVTLKAYLKALFTADPFACAEKYKDVVQQLLGSYQTVHLSKLGMFQYNLILINLN